MSDRYEGPERRVAQLSEDQMEAIAELAAEKAFRKVYEEVGRSVVKRIFWIIGAAALGLLWYSGKIGLPLK